jgi:hypothetical protein
MVESLAIGAMNVNSALKYFQARHNGVVTGRSHRSAAALETDSMLGLSVTFRRQRVVSPG